MIIIKYIKISEIICKSSYARYFYDLECSKLWQRYINIGKYKYKMNWKKRNIIFFCILKRIIGLKQARINVLLKRIKLQAIDNRNVLRSHIVDFEMSMKRDFEIFWIIIHFMTLLDYILAHFKINIYLCTRIINLVLKWKRLYLCYWQQAYSPPAQRIIRTFLPHLPQ